MSTLRPVKASAGSGKTWRLTRDYIERLSKCSHSRTGPSSACLTGAPKDAPLEWAEPGELLAVTFTNAAAAEMKDRVIATLKRAALGLEACPLDSGIAMKWLDILLRDMSSLNIRTIDSLLHMLVRSSSLTLDLNPDFEVEFEDREALAPYLEQFLAEAESEGAYRQLLREACEVVASGTSCEGFWTGDRLSRRLYDVLSGALLGEFDDMADQESIREALKKIALPLMAQAARLLESIDALPRNAKGDDPIDKRAREAFSKKAAGDFENDSKYNEKSHPREFFKASYLKNFQIPDSLNPIYEEYKKQLKICRESAFLLDSALALHPFIKLARLLSVAFLGNRKAEGKLPASLLPSFATQLLATRAGVSEALCRLGARLKHILVDEFQDTSRKQWEVLRQLADEALANGGSLTWVGDVKQSIYGWRSGDPTLFDEVGRDPGLLQKTGGKIDPLLLGSNYRSAPEIVRHSNELFGSLAGMDTAIKVLAALLPNKAPEHIINEYARRLAASFKDVKQICANKSGPCGYVKATTIDWPDSGEHQALVLERLLDTIRGIAKRRPYSDILLLVRGNDQGLEAAKVLVEAGIPVVTENSLLLSENPLIMEIVAFLSFLDNPEDDISFWTLISGDILGGSFRDDEPGQAKLADWAAGERRGALCWKFREDFQEAWDTRIKPFHNQASLITPYDIVMEWLSFMDVEKRFPGQKTFIRRFMEVLQKAEEKGCGSVASFLEYWSGEGRDEKAPMPGTVNAVRIMTIHKAKGLEAPVAIIPWTHFSVKPSENTMMKDVQDLRIPIRLSSSRVGDPFYEDFSRQAIEALNLLYVALTRPREELYFFLAGEGRTQKRRYSYLSEAIHILIANAGLDAAGYELGEIPQGSGASAEEERGEKEAADTAWTGQPEQWRPMRWLGRLKIFRNSLEAERFSARQRGIFIHSCLERMRLDGAPEACAERAFKYGLSHAGINVPADPEIHASLRSDLRWLAALPQSARWLESGWPEQPLTDEEGNSLRADRILFEPWGALVLDYKSGEPCEHDIEQVRAYMNCMEKSGQFPGLKRGLLVYIKERAFRLVDESGASPLLPECPSLP